MTQICFQTTHHLSCLPLNSLQLIIVFHKTRYSKLDTVFQTMIDYCTEGGFSTSVLLIVHKNFGRVRNWGDSSPSLQYGIPCQMVKKMMGLDNFSTLSMCCEMKKFEKPCTEVKEGTATSFFKLFLACFRTYTKWNDGQNYLHYFKFLSIEKGGIYLNWHKCRQDVSQLYSWPSLSTGLARMDLSNYRHQAHRWRVLDNLPDMVVPGRCPEKLVLGMQEDF